MSTVSSQRSSHSSTKYPDDYVEVSNWELRPLRKSFIKTRKLLVKMKRQFEQQIAASTDRLLRLIDKVCDSVQLHYSFLTLICRQPDFITRFEDIPSPPCLDRIIERIKIGEDEDIKDGYKQLTIHALHTHVSRLLASTRLILQVLVKQDELGDPSTIDGPYWKDCVRWKIRIYLLKSAASTSIPSAGIKKGWGRSKLCATFWRLTSQPSKGSEP